MSALLSIQGISKSFDGIQALAGVSFDVFNGDCVALMGENGAGKSTLMKILSGVWPAGSYEGDIFFEGVPYQVNSPVEARKKGISIIYQELSLFPKLSVAENIFLTEKAPYDGSASSQLMSKVRWQKIYENAERIFEQMSVDIDPHAQLDSLSVAGRQLVEIAKAFHQKAKLLILDEPTSALSDKEIRSLFALIRKVQSSMACIYISHKLEEVFEISNRIVVLRDGKTVAEFPTLEATRDMVIHQMVGRPLKQAMKVPQEESSDSILDVTGLVHETDSGRRILKGVDLNIKKGEIVGVAGLMGSGRSEFLRSILGVLSGRRNGKVLFKGNEVRWNKIDEAISAGIAFVPEDRKKDGLFLNQPVEFNLTLPMLKNLRKALGLLDLGKVSDFAKKIAAQMNVKLNHLQDAVKLLSGGNQQKVILARELSKKPALLFLDEPTRGIDVGAKGEIYDIIRRLSNQGVAILMVSSELPEILSLSHRVLILREGKSVAFLKNENLTQENILSYATGV